ncbi:DnaB-like helicase C-terminal domain-containing protein [Borreliella bavariensis]|uniref:DnaB-like helicase C-terminal domain-containing protein n=1 Tax=Borreliella bavariensis TaxID=664662 RepID=UPI00165E181E|nr:DnaB-like helicase C-terminal domain-containing protein [Borreliella bavariensis]
MQNCVNSKDILVDNVQNNANSLEFSYKNKSSSFSDVVDIFDAINSDIQNRNFTESDYISSGFVGLDKIINGFEKSNFVVIGSKTSVGKSAFALNIVNNLCQQNRSVGFFTLEGPSENYMTRLMAMNSRVEFHKIYSNRMDENERLKCNKAFSKIKNFKIYIKGASVMTIHELKAHAREMKEYYGVEIIFIDRIDLISILHNNIPQFPLFEEIADLSRNIRALAKELEIPIIVLCPLYWYDEGREPSLADLGEMESLEQDADTVIFLHRENEGLQDDCEEVRKVKVIVAKNRNGHTGVVTMDFVSSYTRFVDVGVG